MNDEPFQTYRANILRLAKARQLPLAHCLIRGLARRGIDEVKILQLFTEVQVEAGDYRLQQLPEQAQALGFSHCEESRSFEDLNDYSYQETISLRYFSRWGPTPVWEASYTKIEFYPHGPGFIGTDEPMDIM